MTDDFTSGLEFDLGMMRRAARLALRGIGRVEPNPPVGCIIIDPASRRIIAEGWHTHFGGPHAEAHALARSSTSVSGAWAYVTFEPCNHHGKTAPCSSALISAGIRRVVIARKDPNPEAGGGAERLREAGVQVDVLECPEASRLTDPFVKCVTTGMPWVIVKWAQTIDGRVATRTGHSQWISNAESRAVVHRLRARVDAVLSGVGTVAADDPLFTPRNVRRIHRRARRIILDPNLRIDCESKLAKTAGAWPTTVVYAETDAPETVKKVHQLIALGVDLMVIDPSAILVDSRGGHMQVDAVLRRLRDAYGLTSILIEAGPRLVGRLLAAPGIVDELIVFLAPKLVGDEAALPIWTGRLVETMNHAVPLQLRRIRQLGDDVELIYRRSDESIV